MKLYINRQNKKKERKEEEERKRKEQEATDTYQRPKKYLGFVLFPNFDKEYLFGDFDPS